MGPSESTEKEVPMTLTDLAQERYVSLTTFKRDGFGLKDGAAFIKMGVAMRSESSIDVTPHPAVSDVQICIKVPATL